jgi:hypothetical protein
MPNFQTVCRVDDIPEVQSRMFVVEATPVDSFHIDGNFYALLNKSLSAVASLTFSCTPHQHGSCCLPDFAYNRDKLIPSVGIHRLERLPTANLSPIACGEKVVISRPSL